MAQGIVFPEANVVLGPPPGDEDAVYPLHIRRLDGTLVSCWRLTPEEVAEIARTGVVWLSVVGAHTQPPVFVTALKSEVI